MREILFRGKDNSAEWRYGFSVETISYSVEEYDNV